MDLHPTVALTSQVAISPGVAWSAQDVLGNPSVDRVVLAILPAGPIRVLDGPAARLWCTVSEDAGTVDEVIARTISTYEDAPTAAPIDLVEVIQELHAVGAIQVVR